MPGEQEIISKIRRRARAQGGVIVGIGDDAAVLRGDEASDQILCCDLMVEGVHFRLGWADPQMIGRKAMAVTLSDVAAMGGCPLYALVSIALPPAAPSEFIDRLFEGIFDMADLSGVAIVGGDTSTSPAPLFIDTTVMGTCPRGRAVRRRGARAGDRIYVTGRLGASQLGLQLLEQGVRLDQASEIQREALLKHLSPEPRLLFGNEIASSQLATAMIDISDGLSTDLGHILEESSCSAIIDANAIPVARSVSAISDDPLQSALHGGEEYELLFTARPEDHQRIIKCSAIVDLPVTPVGEIIEGRGIRLRRGDTIEEVKPRGYEHLI